MAGNRKAATATLLNDIGLLDKSPNKDNMRYYADLLNGMNDAQFEAFINRLESGEEFVQLKVPNFQKKMPNLEELIAIAKKVDCPLFERVWITDRATGVRYLTPHAYPILFMPLRSQTQSLMSKISVAPHNNTVDNLTGQPTGESKTSTLSYVEQQVMSTHGCDRAIEEFIRPRGGNLKALALMEKQFLEKGSASLDAPGMEQGRVKSLESASRFMFSMHLDNNA